MSRRVFWILIVVLLPTAFLGGYLMRGGGGGETVTEGGRKVLYWVDPMNPAFRSDAPGTAPCGMPLEPVYADAEGAAADAETRLATMPPGTVRVRPDRQQLIGLRVEAVERKPMRQTLRMLGRVAADETRLYRLYSVSEGWIRQISKATTGSLVKKDEILASYYTQEVQGPQQAYLYALEALDRFTQSGSATPEQIEINRKNVRTTRQVLLNLGMSESQTEEIARTRQAMANVDLRSPAPGFVLARNVSLGQRFDRTTELYVVADLSRVWILADAFEGDVAHVRPGMKARASLPGRGEVFEATVSQVPPQFDATTRTLKVRLEADNPGYTLRPDMFADVEIEIGLPEALVVPQAAVQDSGLQKTVFVDRGEGFFEPRRVETGWRLGNLVEVVSGLMPGERVVVSGNFLLDSESRMRLAGAAAQPPSARDPVCGMDVNEAEARAAGRMSVSSGKTWFFCAPGCKETFDRNPGPFSTPRPAHD